MNCNLVNYIKNYNDILDKMTDGMCNAELTDSISHNFITQMIPHHMAAIEMSENILKYTNNSELISIADGIIKEQTESIKNMQKIFGSCSDNLNSGNCVKKYQSEVCKIMKTMITGMKNARANNFINCDFIREMIPHHEGAVKMSENALKFKICTELVPILNAII